MTIVAEGRSLSVGYAAKTVVRDFSFALREGEALLLLGHNGAGKSTLLKTLFGLVAPIAGTYRVVGADATASRAELIKRGTRYLSQAVRSFDALTVPGSRNVLPHLYGVLPGDPKAFGLESEPRAARVGRLSVGQRRLESLLLLSAGRPRLFLLDEPMAGLDKGARQAVADWVGRVTCDTGASFIIAEHEFAELLPVLGDGMVIRGGEVTFIGPAANLANPSVMADVYL